MIFTLLHPRATTSHLGFIPDFLLESDPRPAKEQFNERYAHGGGWFPVPGWSLQSGGRLKYPGDPHMDPIASGKLRDEFIYIYQHAFVCIVQKDGTFEVARMD